MGTLKKLRKMVVIENKTNDLDGTNVFCTSLDLARITGKEHKHILRDIEDSYRKLVELEKDGTISNFLPKYITEDDKMFEDTERVFNSENGQKSDVTALTFGPTSKNQGEIPEKVVIKEYFPKLLKNFRVVRSNYITDQRKTVVMYALDEVMYLCMLNRYNDTLRYYMALYYVTVKDSGPFTVSELVQKSRYEPYYRYMKWAYDDIWENPDSFNGETTEEVLTY